MRSHGRSRRHRNVNNNNNNKGQDDESLLVPRADEPRTESYSRPHHHTESYRAPSTSNRTTYEMNREASSSRGHADSWRPAEATHDRYNYAPSNDGFHRGSRDDYDVAESRDNEPWASRPNSDTHYTHSRVEWSQRYDQGYPPSSYPEPSSSWNNPVPPPAPYDNVAVTYDKWPTEDSRNHLPDERNHSRVVPEERRVSRDTPGWRRDERRDRGGQKWQSDSGWDTRRRENRGKGWNEPSRWKNGPSDKNQSTSDDRSWEPAPTWQPSGRGDSQNQRYQNGHRNNHSNKHSKGGKKGQNQNKQQKRDWRSDDGNLNNWPKRETGSPDKHAKTPIRRKHLRSSSRSRSRSPAESYYSRRSSRGRSRSRSPSPPSKRRRRESSPAVPRSRSPSDRGRAGWTAPERRYSKSPASHHSLDSRGPRQRSLSTASSMSTSSRSRSPLDRPRPVHRLPPSTAVVTVSPTVLHRGSGTAILRDSGSHRKGKNQANGKHGNRADRNAFPLTQSSSLDDMPPPSTIPISHGSRPLHSASDTSVLIDTAVESRAEAPRSKASRITPIKNAGFKPIAQTSSALKRFFPGDDDDADVAPDVQPQSFPAIRPRSQEISHELQASALEASSHLEVQDDDHRHPEPPTRRSRSYWIGENSGRRPDTRDTRHSMPSSPHDQPHRSSFTEDPELPKPSRNGDQEHPRVMTPTTQVQQAPDQDAAGASTPSGGSRGELYAIVSQVGEGTFGKVYKARNTVTKVHVALKRIRMESERDGFPVTAMREIKLLQSLRHENVVRLYEMMVSNGSVYMVFEYMDHDLTGVLSQTQFSFTPAHLKSLCHQMLAGLAYLHHKGVIHRDIKGSNILINNRGELKLADFGLARFYQKRRRTDYTNRVITLWYRPPELLFGATVYGPEVDMWSAGCIMLELFTKKPVFQGNDEIHQLDVIYKIIGTPTSERWSGVLDLPWYELVKPRDIVPNHFRELFQKWMSPAALDLAERLLAYDPSLRATALQAMDAPYFTQEEPRAAPPVGLATLEGEWHELETKRERAKKRRKTETTI